MDINEMLKDQGIPLFFPVRLWRSLHSMRSNLLFYSLTPVQAPPSVVWSAQVALEVRIRKKLSFFYLSERDSQCGSIRDSKGRMVPESG